MSRIQIAAGCLGLFLAANAAAELRTYDVDFKYQEEVYEALESILSVDPAIASAAGLTYGRVQKLPTGQIVVDAAPETHREIEMVLEAVKARQTVAGPRITLRYWVVLGTSAAQPPPGDTPPPILNDVLVELRRAHGDLTFRVLGAAALVTESGQDGEIASLPVAANQTVYVQGDTATAEIELIYIEPDSLLRMPPAQAGLPFATLPEPYVGSINLNVTLKRGDFFVLGESTVKSSGLDGTLFYIAHWPENQ
jgi:hypothetical protein